MVHVRPATRKEMLLRCTLVGSIPTVAFLLFFSFYSLVLYRRILEIPARYETKARHLLRQSHPDPQGALLVLRKGMDFYLPTTESPFRVLHDTLNALALTTEAQLALLRWQAQQWLRTIRAGGPGQLNAVQSVLNAARAHVPYTHAEAMLLPAPFDVAWGVFRDALGNTETEREQWDTLDRFDRLILLDLAGWQVSRAGKIGSTGASVSRPLIAVGCGHDVGKRSVFAVGERRQDYARRGMTCISLFPDTLEPHNIRTIDIYENPDGNRVLVEFLRYVPPGAILVLLVTDEAARNLDQPLFFSELEQFGLSIEPTDDQGNYYLRPRESFAAIGVRRAPKGSGLHAHTRRDDWPAGIVILPSP